MAIAWMYRADYNRAGYSVLPAGELGASFMMWQVAVPLMLLIPLSMRPAFIGQAGLVYFATAAVLGVGFAHQASQLAVHRSPATARRLLLASIVYLPTIFVLMEIDRR